MVYTIDEYFAIELASEERHEYFAGEITVLPGASLAQGRISVNVIASFHAALRGSPCEMFGWASRTITEGDMRLTGVALEIPLALVYERVTF